MHAWFSPPHVGQVVLYNDTKGIIADTLDFVDNGLGYVYDINDFVLVKFNDETINAIELGNLRPEPIIATTNDTEEKPPIIHDDWDWQLPFVVGQRVTLNPTHRNFYIYNQQSDGSLGVIIDVEPYIFNNWDDPDILNSFIHVDWDNNHKNSYPINSLLPVGDIAYTRTYNPNDFKVGMQVSTKMPNSSIKNGWIIDTKPNTICFLDDSIFDTYWVNKDFVTITNTQLTKIIAYTFPTYGTYYCPSNTQNPRIDDLVFNHNIPAVITEIINTDETPSPPLDIEERLQGSTSTTNYTFSGWYINSENDEDYDEDSEEYDEDDKE